MTAEPVEASIPTNAASINLFAYGVSSDVWLVAGSTEMRFPPIADICCLGQITRNTP